MEMDQNIWVPTEYLREGSHDNLAWWVTLGNQNVESAVPAKIHLNCNDGLATYQSRSPRPAIMIMIIVVVDVVVKLRGVGFAPRKPTKPSFMCCMSVSHTSVTIGRLQLYEPICSN
jgi:hypothetical protein